MGIAERLAIETPEGFTLNALDTSATPESPGKKEAKTQLEGDLGDRIFDLHELMMANEKHSMLLVLQGSDASGKSGTIKHVVRRMNPVGVNVASFVEPTEEEKEHHFLWRMRQELPEPGQLTAFDRSHYEDLVVPRVEGQIDDDELSSRVDDVNDFEGELLKDDVIVIKCFLAVSYEEQTERFLRRLRRDDKRWKFNPDDMDTRDQWDAYQLAYADAIRRTNTNDAPWHVIPADKKWYRNWAIGNIICERLEALNLKYPQPSFDLEELRERLHINYD